MKNLLAIECSTTHATVALLYQGRLISKSHHQSIQHAKVLLGLIESMLREAHASIASLDGILFGQGPGSFTGIRVASSIAKGLAFAHQLPLYPISSLSVLAYLGLSQLQSHEQPIVAMIDARMGEVYWSYFPAHADLIENLNPHVSRPSCIELPNYQPCLLAAYGIELNQGEYSKQFLQTLQQTIFLAPDASAMIELIQQYPINPVNVIDAEPLYVRNDVV